MLAHSALVVLAAFLSLSPTASLAAPSPPLQFQDEHASGLSRLDAHLAEHASTSINNNGFSLDLDEMRLISFGDDEEPIWVTEMEKIKIKAEGKRRFMDITDHPTLGMTNLLSPGRSIQYSYPSPSNSSKTFHYIDKLYPSLSTSVMRTILEKFTSFRTRYYRSQTGAESEHWLFAKVREYGHVNPDVKIREFLHPWGQNSIIAHFPSKKSIATGKKDKDEPITIIGAHQDSTNLWPFLPAPGADDDGSGTTSILDAFRVLADSQWLPSDGPVEFHWYSAEEGGLLGSQAVAKHYESKGAKVKAMIQMDMTAWVKQGTTEVVGVITDFVDPALTEFIAKLVDVYLSIPPVPTKCGYACSDHASWSKAGYQSAFSIESTFENSNHGIHSVSDTIDHAEFSFEHMQEFSKLAMAFAVELGGV